MLKTFILDTIRAVLLMFAIYLSSYAIATPKFGFLIGILIGLYVYGRNFYK